MREAKGHAENALATALLEHAERVQPAWEQLHTRERGEGEGGGESGEGMGKRAAGIPAVEASRRGRKGASASLSVTGFAKRKGGGSPSSKPKPARATEWTQEVRSLSLSVLLEVGGEVSAQLVLPRGVLALATLVPAEPLYLSIWFSVSRSLCPSDTSCWCTVARTTR